MSFIQNFSQNVPKWSPEEKEAAEGLLILNNSPSPIYSVDETWRNLQVKNYAFIQQILNKVIENKAQHPYEERFKKSISQLPVGVLSKSLNVIYNQCVHPGYWTDEQKLVAQIINAFFTHYYLKNNAVTFLSNNGIVRYDAHEITQGLKYSIFAGVPPFKNVFSEKIFHDFLKEKKISTIIDLTNTKDHERSLREHKCDYVYWTSVHEYVKAESVFKAMETAPEISKIDIKDREVWRFNFKWPDGKGTKASELYVFIKGLVECGLGKGNFFVHCLAGLGRTGTFTVCLQLFEATKDHQHPLWVDPLKTISDLIHSDRAKRGPGFVQTIDQLITICEFAKILLEQEEKLFK